MKKIKIAPLTNAKSLHLNINYRQEFNLGRIENGGDNPITRLNALVAQFKAQGMDIIMAQPSELEGEVAISTQLKLQNGESVFFPEPNPVHLLFFNAVEHFENAIEQKKEFEDSDKINVPLLYISFNKFFIEISTGVIMLYSSIEAFINQHIRENPPFQINDKLYTKREIEYMDLQDKIKKFMPLIFGIKFHITNNSEYQKILDIRNIRNDLIHLKTEALIDRTFYQNMFSTLYNSKTNEFIEAIFIFMNAFRPGYLVEEKI